MESINPYEPSQADQWTARPIATPTSVIEILQTGVLLFVGNFRALAMLVLIGWGPIELFVTYCDYHAPDPDRMVLYSLVIENVFAIIPLAGMIAIGAAAMDGRRASWWDGLRAGLAAWPRMLATRILVSIFVLLGTLLCLLPGLYVFVRSAVAEVAAVVECRNGMTAPQRSFELTKGKSWQFLAICIVAYGLVYLVAVLISLPLESFPQQHLWLVAAVSNVAADLISAVAVQILVAAYWASAHAPPSEATANSTG